MALSSTIIPYLALLSLLVACVPGIYWGYRRLRQYMEKRHNQQNDAIPFSNPQQSPPAILLDENPQHSFTLPFHQPTNSGRHRVSSATATSLSYPGPVPMPGYRTVWFSAPAVFISPHTEGPGRLYTDPSYQRTATWFEPSHELYP